MKKTKTDFNQQTNPNFILCDMGIQKAFAQMCQQFQTKTTLIDETSNDWLIIDNDTGEIITPKSKNKT